MGWLGLSKPGSERHDSTEDGNETGENKSFSAIFLKVIMGRLKVILIDEMESVLFLIFPAEKPAQIEACDISQESSG